MHWNFNGSQNDDFQMKSYDFTFQNGPTSNRSHIDAGLMEILPHMQSPGTVNFYLAFNYILMILFFDTTEGGVGRD